MRRAHLLYIVRGYIRVLARTICGCNVNPHKYSRTSTDLFLRYGRRRLVVMEFDIRIDAGGALRARIQEKGIQATIREGERDFYREYRRPSKIPTATLTAR